MNNYMFCAQWIFDRKQGKNVCILDYGCGPGEIVKAMPRLHALSWLPPLLTVFMLAGLTLTSARVEAVYTVVELEANLPEESGGSVRGLTDRGEVVGGGQVNGRQEGFYIGGDGRRQKIVGLSGTDHTVARGINLAREVVGSVNTRTGRQGFRSLVGGRSLPLKPLTSDNSSVAFDINEDGESAGQSSGSSGASAVIWSRLGVPRKLPGLLGSQSSKALAIDRYGNAAGVSVTASGTHAVVWKDGEIEELGELPGQYASEARDMNDNGGIVGFSEDQTQQRHAMYWTTYGAGPRYDLGTLQGGFSSWAHGVSNSGQVVGTSQTKDGVTHAFLWTKDNGMQDLNELAEVPDGVVLIEAVRISSPRGRILVIGKKDARPDTAEASEDLSIFRLDP